MDYLALIETEQQESEMQSQVAIKPKGFRPVETVSLVEGMQDIIAGRWRGNGLLDVLDEHTHIFGRQVLIVEPGKDRHRLKEEYPSTMMFEPAEFLDVIENWPESAGLVQAKRTFAGDVMASQIKH